MDRYTKVVLTLIAFALWANLILGVVRPGGVIREANAQAMMQGCPGGYGCPVYITGYVSAPGNNPTSGLPPITVAQASSPLSVNLVGVNSHSLQDPSVTIPVTVADITGVGGTSVRGTGAIPVNPGSKPVAVTGAVSVTGDVSVIVKKLPPAAAPVPQSTSSSSPPSTSTLPGN
jgi:hypothetical protein